MRFARIAATLLAVGLVGCAALAQPVAVSSAPSATPAPTETPTVATTVAPSPTETPTQAPPDCSGPVPVYPCNYKSPIPPTPIACTSAFCYPRLGIDGPIIDDPSRGATDPLLTIVRDTTYTYALAISAHGYTSFGNIAEWRSGDDVQVYGKHYTVFGAFTVPCGQHVSIDPSTKLFMQTSLNSEPCETGKHLDLFVMAR